MTGTTGLSLCVYCSSSTYDERLLKTATEVGAAVAQRGWTLVTGGGNVSMMGAVAGAARAGGARTIGIIPERLKGHEVADLHSDELVVVDTMRQRKQLMDDRSDAFLTLPGGIGTLEEMFETWTSATLGFHDKPVVIYDPVGFYTPLLQWLATLRDQGLICPAALDRLAVADTLEQALTACESRQ